MRHAPSIVGYLLRPRTSRDPHCLIGKLTVGHPKEATVGVKAKRALIAHFRKDFDEAGRSEKVRVPIYAVPDDGTGSQARDARADAASNSFWVLRG